MCLQQGTIVYVNLHSIFTNVEETCSIHPASMIKVGRVEKCKYIYEYGNICGVKTMRNIQTTS